ncbi:hypothetical protein ACOMHN_012909 [Nucella lapillus]
MIEHLEDVLENSYEKLDSQTIKFYVNFSPCFECSEDIKEFLDRADQFYGIDLKLEIIFAHLYKIRRPTCMDDNHRRNHNLPDLVSHRRNMKGLRNLVDFGVDLHPFAEEDWECLCEVLGSPGEFIVEEYEGSAREEEDENLTLDLQQLGL